MKHIPFKAFTLVELIVVITILAILGTIGFISLQGYSVNARDSVRISDTKTFLKALNVYQTKNNTVPLPDDLTTLTASGSAISYQGTLSGSVIKALGQGAVPLDPTLKTPYLYATNLTQTKFQILRYMEKNASSNTPVLSQGFAGESYSDMFPKVIGDEIGFLLSETNTPVSSGSVEIQNSTTPYTYILSPEKKIAGSGSALMTLSPLSSCKRILDAGLSQGSGVYAISPTTSGSIDVYCNMDIDGGGWTYLFNVQENLTTYPAEGVLTDPDTDHSRLYDAEIQALAENGYQVRIQTRDSNQYVQSKISDPYAITQLRNLQPLHDDSTKDDRHFEGNATQHLLYGCNTTQGAWPDLYWSCGNRYGLHIYTYYRDSSTRFGWENNRDNISVMIR